MIKKINLQRKVHFLFCIVPVLLYISCSPNSRGAYPEIRSLSDTRFYTPKEWQIPINKGSELPGKAVVRENYKPASMVAGKANNGIQDNKSGTPNKSAAVPASFSGDTQGKAANQPKDQMQGVASWYGPNFHGLKTANGEIYNQHEMTAAHKYLPINTLVRVTNIDNGKQTIVRINDRGPYSKGRIIDLSRAAAEQIDMVGRGTANVELEVVQYPSNFDPSIGIEAYKQTVVQLAAFNNQKSADYYKEEISRRYSGLTFFVDNPPNSNFHVVAGPYNERTAAEDVNRSFANDGVKAVVRSYRNFFNSSGTEQAKNPVDNKILAESYRDVGFEQKLRDRKRDEFTPLTVNSLPVNGKGNSALFRSKILTAVSGNGLTFEPAGKPVVYGGTYPSVIYMGETVICYYLAYKAGDLYSVVAAAVSDNNGKSWYHKYVYIKGIPGERKASYPYAVKLPDSGVRLYFLSTTVTVEGSGTRLHYADSSDGFTFEYKAPVFGSPERVLKNYSVSLYQNRWVMFARTEDKIPEYISKLDNGNYFIPTESMNFTVDGTKRYIHSTMTFDKRFRAYGYAPNGGGIRSFYTLNLQEWVPDNLITLPAAESGALFPSVTAVPNEYAADQSAYLMLYSTQNRPE
ncbi:hypothetical protein CHS0354_035240 [Potamilus streckersoni]|uniref:SPOR domain-containing protein n=1 Tax=Potamilus streckersoni TaxID=2493646 RepID=A0AAE0VPF0_9BIVA|nr:hypothetical protein CHS0354_035240 [Potamilus streckersoni]